MEQIKRLAGFGSVLCCILLSASGLSAQVPGHTVSDIVRDGNNAAGYTFCKVAVPHPGGQTETYYSDVFSVPRGNLRAASDAFLQFLAEKYSLQLHPPDSTCEDLLSARQADAQSRLDRTEGTNIELYKVVKTGWTYSGAGAAGAAPAAQPSGGPATPVSYGYCFVQAPSGWYFSAVLVGRALAGGSEFGGAIPQGFQSFVQAKYGVQESARCQTLHSLADAQTFLQRAEEAERSYRLNVVETGWTYSAAGSAGAAPPAPAQPIPRPTPTRSVTSQPDESATAHVERTSYVSCAAPSDPKTVYLSAMFSTTRVDYDPAWQTAFVSFLKTKYGYQGYAGCNKLSSAADEQAYIQKSIANYRIKQNDGSTPRKIVETGWTYAAP